MVFWRSKSNKDEPRDEAAKVADSADPKDGASGAAAETGTAIVASTPSRLADRLTEISPSRGSAAARAKGDESLIPESDPLILPGQSAPLAAMREVFKDRRASAHLLILGAEGTGRRWAAEKLATLTAQDMAAAREWVYVGEPDNPARLKAFEFPAGRGARFVVDVQSALGKAWGMRMRILDSDDHRLARNLLDEEVRNRGEAALEHLRRRAEQQNIALVKSIDGYVLAPMHEGRMVRPEIFRALPEALQRDVEAKINALEGELHGLVAASPDSELEASEKYAALDRHVAMTAVKPNIAVLRKLYTDLPAAATALDLIERGFVTAAEGDGANGAVRVTAIRASNSHAHGQGGEAGAPVVVARNVARSALVGTIGRDAAGGISIAPGSLVNANEGFLIVEAWRLALDTAGWAALSEAMDAATIAPERADGVAVIADPIPFTARVIVVADTVSWKKIKDLDPGAEKRFRTVATFADTATVGDVSEAAFAAAAATLARETGLRDIYASAGKVLYEDAIKRGSGRVSLDRARLLRLLEEADGLAASASADHIRAQDMRQAAEHLATGSSA